MKQFNPNKHFPNHGKSKAINDCSFFPPMTDDDKAHHNKKTEPLNIVHNP